MAAEKKQHMEEEEGEKEEKNRKREKEEKAKKTFLDFPPSTTQRGGERKSANLIFRSADLKLWPSLSSAAAHHRQKKKTQKIVSEFPLI